jgi:hypothetical protein
MLSKRIRLVTSRRRSLRFSKKQVRFYRQYSSFVYRALRRPRYERFLSWLLRKEEINQNDIADIQIRLFPHRSSRGKILVGKRRKNGQILIYPRTHQFCKKLIAKHGIAITQSYITNRARAALVHEILHAKYSSNEQRVRNLTRQYFTIFARSIDEPNRGPTTRVHTVSRLLFRR